MLKVPKYKIGECVVYSIYSQNNNLGAKEKTIQQTRMGVIQDGFYSRWMGENIWCYSISGSVVEENKIHYSLTNKL